ncbi:SpoIIE family protein phosphatase [Streptomyces seoulensis]|uniref:SpoIIE family protein phosphatase n=1 Tax=Streptomyces seoulensis TaxID=73044 RepID=UPI001FCC8979|nr:SpoIIE family protein phosphatase [Streptomyces seoulensis]
MTSEPASPVDPGFGADVAALAKVVARQRAELERLRDLAASSAVLERAKGALMAMTGRSADSAHGELLARTEAGRRTLIEECWLTLGALEPPKPTPADTEDPGPLEPWSAASRQPAPTAPGDLADVLGDLGRDLVRVGSPQELAGYLLRHLGPDAAADAVLLYQHLPEDGLELIGYAGIDAALAGRWHHMPPLSRLAPLECLRTGEPRWLEDLAADRRRYLLGDPPDRWHSRAWLPVPAGPGSGVALGVLRTQEGPFEPRERRLLLAAARLCAGRLRAFDAAADGETDGAARSVQAVLDGLPGAAILLCPLRAASGAVEDYRIEAASPEAVDVFGNTGREMIGRHILESYPSVAGEQLWHGYLTALTTGVPFESAPFAYQDVVDGVPVTATYSVRAAPLADGLLVTWLRLDPLDRQEQRLWDVQRLGNLGWANWNLVTGDISWSAQTYAVLGLNAARGPVALAELPALVAPQDSGPLRAAITGLVRHARPFDVPFRMETPDGVRHLRIVAEAVTEPDGTPAEVHGFVQDLTAQRSAELALVESERAMLLQRGVLQAERALADRLQHALLPLPAGPVRLAGLRVEVAYLPAQSGIQVGGDWFSAIELSDDAALFVVGDVAGHGIGAVATMAQLRFTAKGMVGTGSSLTGALTRLNTLLLHSRDGRSTATMVLARYDPTTRVLAWAQAGHPPPLLVRGGTARFLTRPVGMLLGASATPVFDSAEARLEPGDRLLLFTDGLVERPGEDVHAGFARLADTVRTHGEDSLDTLLGMMLVDEHRDDVCVVDIRLPVE